MEKLIEMMNAGVAIALYGGHEYVYRGGWSITAKRTDDGIALEIKVTGDSLRLCIDDLYEKWLSATGRGLPTHSLKQIEYTPPALDDEILF